MATSSGLMVLRRRRATTDRSGRIDSSRPPCDLPLVQPARLDRLSVDDAIELTAAIRDVAKPALTMADAAQAITAYVRSALLSGAHEPACVLVRLYTTVRERDLPPEIVTAGAALPSPGHRPHLTLLGTSGELDEWNDRGRSASHAAIPLDRADVLGERAPMIAGLLAELGVDIDAFVDPDDGGALLIHHQEYGIFHVDRAEGSPLIPAQDFVRDHSVRSVVGCGGGLPSGEVFVLVLFSKVDIDVGTASLFRTVAFGIKAALVPYTYKVFTST